MPRRVVTEAAGASGLPPGQAAWGRLLRRGVRQDVPHRDVIAHLVVDTSVPTSRPSSNRWSSPHRTRLTWRSQALSPARRLSRHPDGERHDSFNRHGVFPAGSVAANIVAAARAGSPALGYRAARQAAVNRRNSSARNSLDVLIAIIVCHALRRWISTGIAPDGAGSVDRNALSRPSVSRLFTAPLISSDARRCSRLTRTARSGFRCFVADPLDARNIIRCVPTAFCHGKLVRLHAAFLAEAPDRTRASPSVLPGSWTCVCSVTSWSRSRSPVMISTSRCSQPAATMPMTSSAS